MSMMEAVQAQAPAQTVAPAAAQPRARRRPAPAPLRSYFDGQHDWEAESTHRVGLIGPKRGRSEEMRAIDSAVRGVTSSYQAGWHPMLRAALDVLAGAITAWRDANDGGQGHTRSADVDRIDRSRGDLASKLDLWEGGLYALAIRQHGEQKAQVRAWIDEGARSTTNLHLRNSCEWVQTGRLPVYVATETADAEHRAQVQMGKRAPNATVFFPDPDLANVELMAAHPAAVAYDKFDPRVRAGTTVNQKVNGWNTAGKIVVTDIGIGASKAEVLRTIRHEVQHQADRHRDDENSPEVVAARAPDAAEGELAYQEAVREYRTEYRAHWYQGGSAWDDIRGVDVRGLNLAWGRKQWAVFQKIRADYPKIALAVGGDVPNAQQLRFRREVNSYRDPDEDGFNKLNSVRIDRLYNALNGVAVGAAELNAQGAEELLAAVNGLNAADAGYIRDEDRAVKLRAKIVARLAAGSPLKAEVNRILAAKDP
jgi:hypothetical protein